MHMCFVAFAEGREGCPQTLFQGLLASAVAASGAESFCLTAWPSVCAYCDTSIVSI